MNTIIISLLLLGSPLAHALSGHETTFSLPAVKRRDLTPRQSSGNETTINVGSDWYIPVSIGTPPQHFYFLGDSGAPGFAVASTLLPEDEQPPAGATKYNPNASSTSHQRDGYTYSLIYGSGASSSGVVFQDVVTIGNLTVPDMDIETQTKNNHDQSQHHGPRSGNLGLNIDIGQTTKPTRLPTWLQRVVPNLTAGVFTVNYNATSSTGTFDFGFIDPSKYTGSIGYAPIVNDNGEWQIQITGQQLANGTYIPSDNFNTTIDTGSSGAGVPRKVADNYFSQVDGAVWDRARGNYVYPCGTRLPDYTFGIGAWRGTVHGTVLEGEGEGNCTWRLNVGTGENASLWGQFLIEQFFVVFDWHGRRVGFAEKNTGGGRACVDANAGEESDSYLCANGSSTSTMVSAGSSTTATMTTGMMSETASSTAMASTGAAVATRPGWHVTVGLGLIGLLLTMRA